MRASRLILASLAALATAGPALAAEGGGMGEALITPQFGTFFWTLVTFLIMVWMLGRYAWKPLLAALAAREHAIRDNIDQARTEREEAQSLLEQHKQLLADARRERATALEQGRSDAEKLRAEILAEADKQRQLLLQQAETQMQAEMRQARAELRGLAVDLSIKAAERLLVKNLDDKTQRRLVEDYLAGLAREGSDPPSA